MKKYEVTTIDAVQRLFVLEAGSVEDAIDMVVDGDVQPVEQAVIYSEIDNAKEIRYEN